MAFESNKEIQNYEKVKIIFFGIGVNGVWDFNIVFKSGLQI
jgi:hypothetical protein